MDANKIKMIYLIEICHPPDWNVVFHEIYSRSFYKIGFFRFNINLVTPGPLEFVKSVRKTKERINAR